MSRSFGLALYGLGRRAEPVVVRDWPARPPGRLVWLNAPTAHSGWPLLELARRLVDEDAVSILLTCPEPMPARAGVTHVPPPGDTAAEARAFLAHFRPEAAVFSDGALRPGLQHEAQVAGLAMLMVDARAPRALRERDGWYPGLMRGALSVFRQIFATDETAARALRKAGAPPERVVVTGRMEEESAALPCLEAERAVLARQLATRPVWLAAAVPEAEEETVIAAHREALKLSHRLLLILVPESPERGTALAARMEEAEGWMVALRLRDDEPTPDTEVYIPDSCAEMGLWYRLAPISYMGGSLTAGCIRNPMEPAALGSAITYGPRAGQWAANFGRLGAARAARAVSNGRDLAEALSDLMAPDRAARLAQAAWAVASEGAEVTDRVVAELRGILDGEGGLDGKVGPDGKGGGRS